MRSLCLLKTWLSNTPTVRWDQASYLSQQGPTWCDSAYLPSYHSPHWPSLYSISTPNLSWPQCLCTCCFFCLQQSSPIHLHVSLPASIHVSLLQKPSLTIPILHSLTLLMFLPCTITLTVCYVFVHLFLYLPPHHWNIGTMTLSYSLCSTTKNRVPTHRRLWINICWMN